MTNKGPEAEESGSFISLQVVPVRKLVPGLCSDLLSQRSANIVAMVIIN